MSEDSTKLDSVIVEDSDSENWAFQFQSKKRKIKIQDDSNGNTENKPKKKNKKRELQDKEIDNLLPTKFQKPELNGEECDLTSLKQAMEWTKFTVRKAFRKLDIDEEIFVDSYKVVEDAIRGLEASEIHEDKEKETKMETKEKSKSNNSRRKDLKKQLKNEQIIVLSSKINIDTLKEEFGENIFTIDVSKTGKEPWNMFNPNYPAKAIPVPYTTATYSISVDSLWESLKVFEHEDIDIPNMTVTKGIKRSATEKRGDLQGWRKGVTSTSEVIKNCARAKSLLYLPVYKLVIERDLKKELEELKNILQSGKKLIILDNCTHYDMDSTKSLSGGYLLKHYLQGHYLNFGN